MLLIRTFECVLRIAEVYTPKGACRLHWKLSPVSGRQHCCRKHHFSLKGPRYLLLNLLPRRLIVVVGMANAGNPAFALSKTHTAGGQW
jgi:hypothetical protein